MRIVSVVNYKGGVGKTTLTANIGAGLADMGKRVLLIDLDPQASLTFSFFNPVEWQEQLADDRTIKKWYDSPNRGKAVTKLSDLIVAPPKVAAALGKTDGCVEMIASHRDLVMIDALLAGAIDPKSGQVPPSRFVQVYRRLADGLSDASFSTYDFVLIDCPPNFHMMTKNAVVASDFLLIPSRADYLSINGINHLGGAVLGFVRDYNVHASRAGSRPPALKAPSERVAFTMVQFHFGAPIEAQGVAISQVRALRVPIFNTLVRDRKAIYAVAPEHGVPAILLNHGRNEAADEMRQFVDEFIHWTERTPS